MEKLQWKLNEQRFEKFTKARDFLTSRVEAILKDFI